NANKIARLPTPVVCGPGPRPAVQVTTQRTGANALQVTVVATINTATPVNSLQSLDLAADSHVANPNARIDVSGGPTNAPLPLTITPPSGATSVTFTVRPATA